MLRVYDDMAMCASYAYAGNVDDFCLRSRFHLSMDFRLKIYIEIYILVYMYMIYIYIDPSQPHLTSLQNVPNPFLEPTAVGSTCLATCIHSSVTALDALALFELVYNKRYISARLHVMASAR